MLTIDTPPTPLSVDDQGVVLVSGTRVSLDTIVAAFDRGSTPEEICQQYPTLDLAAVYAVIWFYLRRRTEVEVYLAGRRQQSAAVRKVNESQFDPQGIRERLLSRRKP